MTPEVETSSALVRQDAGTVARVEDFMPLMNVQQAIQRKAQINEFIKGVMVEGEDYGLMPGNDKKKVLMKPGAEKLTSIFGLRPTYEGVQVIEDWTGAEHGGEPLFYYEYRCQLTRANGIFMGEAIGSCNSWESKYRYRWVTEAVAKSYGYDTAKLPQRGGRRKMFEPVFALDKAETTGRYGKPAEYWEMFKAAAQDGRALKTRKKLGTREFDGYELEMDETQYRMPNPEVADVVNTCQKMAQKRALVAAVLIVTNCSDAFTQDIEDFDQPEPSGPAPVAGNHSDSQPSTAAPAPERTVPEELQQLVNDIHQGKKGTVTAALSMFESQFVRRGGADGLKQFNAMRDAYRAAVPKEKETKATLVVFFLDLWDELGRMPAAAERAESV